MQKHIAYDIHPSYGRDKDPLPFFPRITCILKLKRGLKVSASCLVIAQFARNTLLGQIAPSLPSLHRNIGQKWGQIPAPHEKVGPGESRDAKKQELGGQREQYGVHYISSPEGVIRATKNCFWSN